MMGSLRQAYSRAAWRKLSMAALHVAIFVIAGCSPDTGADAAAPAKLAIDGRVISASGFGEFSFIATDGNELSVNYYRAQSFRPADRPIWFVMHGASRDAERYINLAAPVAERYNALALVINFPKSFYPRSSDYTLNVTTHGRADAGALAQGRWKTPDQYLYVELERLFDAVKDAIGGNQQGYFIFGHSAGAQFTHRLLTFMPEHRVLRAVAANAGWYTLPLGGAGAARTMPYGLGNSPVDGVLRQRLLNSPLTILVGERDTATPDQSSMVLDTPAAMAQGRNRFERARYYFAAAGQAATELETPLRWNFAVVPRAKHSARQMVASAAHYLFSAEPANCEPTPAARATGVRITEVLADPPADIHGDANNDASRDSLADEFIELVNTGEESVCLAGWAIGDAKNPERHVFPLGTQLDSGATLVVFGGGQPTGSFGSAQVQWAAFDGKLSLSNNGDVITVRDRADQIVDQVSWGDCEAKACARAHYPFALNISRSIVRSGRDGEIWLPIPDIDKQRFSPGLADDQASELAGTPESYEQPI
jgi:hypothetical protein